MLSRYNNKFFFFTALLVVTYTGLRAQPEVRLYGPGQAKAGVYTGITLSIKRNGISGPVRFVQELPRNWKAELFPGARVHLSQTGTTLRLAWLSFPLKDSIHCSYGLRIPDDTGDEYLLGGTLEYFENGTLRQLPVTPHRVKLVKFYSRVHQ